MKTVLNVLALAGIVFAVFESVMVTRAAARSDFEGEARWRLREVCSYLTATLLLVIGGRLG